MTEEQDALLNKYGLSVFSRLGSPPRNEVLDRNLDTLYEFKTKRNAEVVALELARMYQWIDEDIRPFDSQGKDFDSEY